MKAFDIISIDNLTETKKKKRKVKIPEWFKSTTFKKGPHGASGWGGWHAWGNDAGGDGGGE